MEVDLEVIASAAIKGQEPWPCIVWVGTKRQSLLMLGRKRVSILYIPTGKTKQKIPHLSNVIGSAVCVSATPTGNLLVGLLDNGDVFVWNKDAEKLQTICGLGSDIEPSLFQQGRCQVFADSSCSKVLVSPGQNQLFLWQRDTSHTYPQGKDYVLVGRWTKFSPPAEMAMPNSSHQESCFHAAFASNSLLGDCCDTSVVFNNGTSLTVCSLLISFHPPNPSAFDSYPALHHQWKCHRYPLSSISPGCEPVSIRGAYVARYSHDASILAVAVNQKSAAHTSMLFVSPVTDMLLLSTMKGCGIRNPDTKRGINYWVRDMAWLPDNLFLACILGNGSVALLSRLGEPVTIAMHGNSVAMGPACFLPLHPIITVRGEESQTHPTDKEFEASTDHEGESLKQVFSVSSHPSLPILVFSDGYLVTFVQLPGELNTFLFMRNLLLESSKHIKQIGMSQNLDLTLANLYNLPAVEGLAKGSQGKPRTYKNKHLSFSFEEMEGSLNETIDCEVNAILGSVPRQLKSFGAVDKMNAGKIVFGEPDALQAALDSLQLTDTDNGLMRSMVQAQHALLLAWKLAASTTEPWTASIDEVVKKLQVNVVKLFSVILECPAIADALLQHQHIQTAAAVQTPSLYQVISMYRQLLEVAQFDALSQHLAPSLLQLAYNTVTTILDSRTLQTTDPRLKTLSGCFTILKFTETTLNTLYVLLPKSVKESRGMGNMFEPAAAVLDAGKRGQGNDMGQNIFDTGQLMAKRLASTWKVLYKAVHTFQQGQLSEEESLHTAKLLCCIQDCLQAINAAVPSTAAISISKGNKLSLDGKHTLAMDAWKVQLKKYLETGKDGYAAELLHSLLYTHLLRTDLRAAVELIDGLVVQASVQSAVGSQTLTRTPPIQPSFLTFVSNTLKAQALQEPDMVPCIRDKAIRQVVQTLARFMAAYFSNQTVYIFPPHNARPLPAVHFKMDITNSRIIPKRHDEISSTVRQQKLSGIWTVERTLEYLLLSGLVYEATWFADQMGNWKTAFQLAVACTLHRSIAPKIYQKHRRPLLLPGDLQPDEILHRKLARLAGTSQSSVMIDDGTNMDELTSTLEDVMLAGVMGHVEVAPQLLTLLLSRLKDKVMQLLPLVPAQLYLPAPPLYCPQPALSVKAGLKAETQREMELRQETASLVQLILAVMNAAHVSIPAMRWYMQQLAAAQNKALQFKTSLEGPCQNFPDILLEQLAAESEFAKVKGDLAIFSVLVSFRDLCSMLWLLHARDKLSESLRKRERFLGSLGYHNQEKSRWEGRQQSEWLSLCWASLGWASHLLPFSRFLSDEASIHKVLVSMLLELAPSTQVADLMAEFFHDTQDIHPELQERLDHLVTSWQSIIVKPEGDIPVRTSQESIDGRKSVTFLGASPRGESLSVYFLKQQAVAVKVVKKKQRCFGHYEEFVFAQEVEPPKKLYVGARPFETKISYFDFLDMFFSISFSKVLDKMKTQNRASTSPLLNKLCPDLLHQEIKFFVENIASEAHKNQGLNVLAGSVNGSQYGGSQDDITWNSETHNSQRSAGSFRGHGHWQHPLERSHANVVSKSERKARKGAAQSPHGLAGAGVIESHGWQLTVNFGRRYTHLQQLVEWLEVWSNKPHKFGLGRQEALMELKPSLKLHIPAQLIVLSLWLLENKYSSADVHHVAAESRGPRSTRGQRGRMSRSPQNVTRGGNNRTSPTRGGIHSPTTAGTHSLSHQADRVRPLLEQETAGNVKQYQLEASLPQSLLEREAIHTAYENALEGSDSSTVDVSTLVSDELPEDLRKVNTALQSFEGSNSALNQRLNLKRSQSPFERPHRPSPPSSVSPLTSQTESPAPRSSSSSAARSPRPRQRDSLAAGDGQESGSLPVSQTSLAELLQQVIRKEMRRIVQIQQQSLNTMMGAIDGDSPPTGAPPIASNSRANRTPARGQKPGLMRNALSELQNLQYQHQQQQTSPVHVLSPSQQDSVQEEVIWQESQGPLCLSHLKRDSPTRSAVASQENLPPASTSPGIPMFLRIPAEKEEDGFRLPMIPPLGPRTAWGPPKVGAGPPEVFPLLKLASGPPQPVMYGPPPPQVYTGAPWLPLPPADAGPPRPLSFMHVPPQAAAPQADSLSQSGGLIGIPLLWMPAPLHRGPGPLFGRCVPPEYLAAQIQEKEKQETARMQHLEAFHNQMLAAREADEKAAQVAARSSQGGLPTHMSGQSQPQPPPSKASTSKLLKLALKLSSSQQQLSQEAQGEKLATSASEEEQEVSVESTEAQVEHQEPEQEQDLEDSKIYDGFAIPPGTFKGYEDMEKQLGVEGDSNTRFQYKLAQAMRKQLEMEKERWLQQKKVDFANNHADVGVDVQHSFESIRTAEAATAIHRDTSVDPAHEAIAEYNRTRQGITLPPDVFLNLHFADGQELQAADSKRGRFFLNVVDVNAANVLRDIPEKGHKSPGTDAESKPGAYLARDASPGRLGVLEQSLREQLEPVPQRRHDAVTVGLFQRPAPYDDKFSVALLPQSNLRDSKTALFQRLRAMNDQMGALDEMSRNMENDFHYSKMLLETVQSMNNSYQHDVSRVRFQKDEQDLSQDQRPDEERLSLDERVPGATIRSPKASARSPKLSARSPKMSARSDKDDLKPSGRSPKREASPFSTSGLSDISDILGELLAEGGVDLTQAGLTPEEADMYTRRAKLKQQSKSPKSSFEVLKTLADNVEQRARRDKSPEIHHRDIHQWMAEKFMERQKEYVQHRQLLKEKEAHPYKSSSQVGTKELKNFEDEREQRRKDKEREDMRHRILEAEYLIGSALTDAEEAKREIQGLEQSLSPRSRSRSKSPVRSSAARTKSKTSTLAGSPWHRFADERGRTVERRMRRPFSAPMDQTFSIFPSKGILKTAQSPSDAEQVQSSPVPVQSIAESSELDLTDESKLRKYLGNIIDEELSEEFSPALPKKAAAISQSRPEPAAVPRKTYKPRPFSQIVRLQRPEITRRVASQEPPTEKYLKEVLAEKAAVKAAKQQEAAVTSARSKLSERTQMSQGEAVMRKAYAQMPRPGPHAAAPRRVKTYTERLQELKPRRRYASPIIPRQEVMDSLSTQRTASRIPTQHKATGPTHKPVTYVEQLKKINREATVQQVRHRGRGAPLQTRMPARRAPHQPKTYTQQLQELNAPYRKPIRTIGKASTSSLPRRVRPYGDPYSEDTGSVLSDSYWKVDDNVRRLLYEEDSMDQLDADMTSDRKLRFIPDDNASDYYEAIMGVSQASPEPDYRDSVDISELERIAEGASIGSGSIMSVIDWGEVGNLIDNEDIY